MGKRTTLEALFPSPTRMILATLFGEPGRWWSVTDLAAKVGSPPAGVRRRLLVLECGGIARTRRTGGRKFFQPDPSCPVYLELHGLLAKLAKPMVTQETILVVEDQEATAQITRILLESWGYRVYEAHSPHEALQLFQERSAEVELVLTDVIMPEMTGPELARELAQRKPGLRIVYMSGYPAEELVGCEGEFLPKPFNPSSLARIIRKQLRPGEIKTA